MLNSSVSSDTVAETREPDRLSRHSVIRRPTWLSSEVMAHLFSIMVTETNDVDRTDRYRPGTSMWKNMCGYEVLRDCEVLYNAPMLTEPSFIVSVWKVNGTISIMQVKYS